MQVTMSKAFNKKEIHKKLLLEDEFISDIFSRMPLPVRVPENNFLIEKNSSSPGTGRMPLPVRVPENNFVKQNAEQNSSSENEESKKEVKTVPTEKAKKAKTWEELQAKLAELKGVKTLDYKEKLLKKYLQNKIKRKGRQKERVLQKRLARERAATGGVSNQKIKLKNKTRPKVPKPKPVFNSEGKMVFSKFDFSEIGLKKKLPKSDPKKMLQQLQQRKEKLKQLEESGDKEKAEEMKEKDAWKAALAKASGEKIKDDPELLKRTIKRKDQTKKHSAKNWNSRKENVEKSMQERQDKRQENIKKRKNENRANKLKKAAKKGRVVFN